MKDTYYLLRKGKGQREREREIIQSQDRKCSDRKEHIKEKKFWSQMFVCSANNVQEMLIIKLLI